LDVHLGHAPDEQHICADQLGCLGQVPGEQRVQPPLQEDGLDLRPLDHTIARVDQPLHQEIGYSLSNVGQP